METLHEPDKRIRPVPIHLITGFLGSGKTTLLSRVIAHFQQLGLKPAVIMNELGEVNLDGELLGSAVPMSEMLGGCICCSIRGDLGVELHALLEEHTPDVIVIESTGAANPLEIIDGVTEVAMYEPVELQSITTVVDGLGLLEMRRRGRNQTFRLMKEQVRCATHLLVNKADRLAPEEIVEVEQLVREWNAVAPLEVTVRSVVGLERFWQPQAAEGADSSGQKNVHEEHDGGACDQHAHDEECHHKHAHAHEHDEACSHTHDHKHTDDEACCSHTHTHEHVHGSHDHVMVYTHYLPHAVSSAAFEQLLAELPHDIYRAKGIVTFTDTTDRFLFQMAYREIDFIRIQPQGKVLDVAVFIGEHFSKSALQNSLLQLEARAAVSTAPDPSSGV